VTSLQLLRFLEGELETPYVVSYHLKVRLGKLRGSMFSVRCSMFLRRAKERCHE
jgi:hypothetical protein